MLSEQELQNMKEIAKREGLEKGLIRNEWTSEYKEILTREKVDYLLNKVSEIEATTNLVFEPTIHYYSELEEFELKYGKKGDAGFDLPINDPRLVDGEYSEDGSFWLQPGDAITLKTGIHIGLPFGYYALADTRSGTSKVRLDLLCRTIDGCYRGNIRVALTNLNNEPVLIENGKRLTQIVVLRHAVARPKRHDTLDEFMWAAGETERGNDGGIVRVSGGLQ